MATTYDYISRNKLKSALLVVFFIAFVTFVGWAIGQWTDFGMGGLFLALIFAAIMSWSGYYFGDRIALMTSGAKGPITREQHAYLYNMVENLCIASGTPVPKIFLIADPSINAFATGRDPQHASIAVTTGALEKLENEELEGVLAHELSHIRNYDVRYMTLVLMLVTSITLLARWFFYSSRFGGRRGSGRNGGAGVFALIGIVLLILSPLIAQLIHFAVSRRREFLADASGALLTRYPEGLARALEKIGRYNSAPLKTANEATAHLFIAHPFGNDRRSASRLFMTHPPIEERIAALRAMGG